MRSVCARIISVIATLGLGRLAVTVAPSASVAASTRSFEGSFAANRTNLQLRYDASSSHYLGTLRLGNDVFPVQGSVATDTFTGRYLQNAQPVPLKATLAAAFSAAWSALSLLSRSAPVSSPLRAGSKGMS